MGKTGVWVRVPCVINYSLLQYRSNVSIGRLAATRLFAIESGMVDTGVYPVPNCRPDSAIKTYTDCRAVENAVSVQPLSSASQVPVVVYWSLRGKECMSDESRNFWIDIPISWSLLFSITMAQFPLFTVMACSIIHQKDENQHDPSLLSVDGMLKGFSFGLTRWEMEYTSGGVNALINSLAIIWICFRDILIGALSGTKTTFDVCRSFL